MELATAGFFIPDPPVAGSFIGFASILFRIRAIREIRGSLVFSGLPGISD
jgi:hypothetical protein